MGVLKVCHMCAAVEGATWMIEQLRELRERFGHDVYALVIDADCDFAVRLREAGIKVIALNFGYRTIRDMVLLPLTILRTAAILRRERVDVLQTHLLSSMVVGRLAGWLADVPVRAAMVASPFHLEAHSSRYIDAATVWMDTDIIPSCEHTATLYKQIGAKEENISLIYYGPDERRFDPEDISPHDIRAEFGWPADTPVVALVAYFYPEMPISRWVPEIAHGRAVKGHEDLIGAAGRVLETFPNAKFILVGGGFTEHGELFRQKMIGMVRDLGLEEKVVFTGHRNDVNAILRSVDVAVQAPIVENLGGTVEALLMERPLVATRVGGIPDSVRDGETGVLVNAGDPADLARGIVHLLGDPERAGTLAKAGRQLMLDRFSLSRTVADLDELYRTRLDARGRGYSPLVAFYRHLLAIPVFAYLGFRVIVIDYMWHIYGPVIRSRVWGRVLYLRSVCLSPVRFGLRQLRRVGGYLGVSDGR